MNSLLPDGSLIKARAERAATAKKMAADLVRHNAFANESDALRCLMALSYPPLQIALLLDDARQIAMQDVVAREMMEP